MKKLNSSQACKKVSYFGYVVWMLGTMMNLCGPGEEKPYLLVASDKASSDRLSFPWPDGPQKFWSSGRPEPRVLRANFCLRSYVFLCVPCIAPLCALSDVCDKRARRAASSRGSNYFGVLHFARTWIPPAWRMWLAGLSQFTIPHLSHSFQLQPGRRTSVCVGGELSCGRTSCSRRGENGTLQNVGGTIVPDRKDGTKKNVMSEKGER